MAFSHFLRHICLLPFINVSLLKLVIIIIMTRFVTTGLYKLTVDNLFGDGLNFRHSLLMPFLAIYFSENLIAGLVVWIGVVFDLDVQRLIVVVPFTDVQISWRGHGNHFL